MADPPSAMPRPASSSTTSTEAREDFLEAVRPLTRLPLDLRGGAWSGTSGAQMRVEALSPRRWRDHRPSPISATHMLPWTSTTRTRPL